MDKLDGIIAISQFRKADVKVVARYLNTFADNRFTTIVGFFTIENGYLNRALSKLNGTNC